MPKTRSFIYENVPTRSDVLEMVNHAEGLRDKALVACSFFLASRVGETLKICKEDLQSETIHDKRFIIFKLHTEKNRTTPIRRLPIPESEPLLYIFKKYADTINSGLIFNFSRVWAWVIIKKASENKIWPHLLRHVRLTELIVDNKFSSHQLTKWAGWTDSRSEKHYLHLRVEDILPI